jgi:hypothetical protein
VSDERTETEMSGTDVRVDNKGDVYLGTLSPDLWDLSL